MKLPIWHIAFEATGRCNLQCKYCYNHWRRADDREPAAPSFRECLATLKQIHRSFAFEHISFTGGEPFLADGLGELILYSRLRGKNVTVLSNGTVGSFEEYRRIADIGVGLFQFPLLSSDEKTHDALTGISGSFRKSTGSIRYLTGLGAEVVPVFVMTKQNIRGLRDTLARGRELGLRRFMLARFNVGGRGIRHCADLLPSAEALKQAFAEANDWARTERVSITANVCVPHCIINPADYPAIRISSCSADFRSMPLTIDFAGNVRICNHSPTVIGNIHHESVTAMFESEYLHTWKSQKPPRCGSCARWVYCNGGCRSASEQMGYTLAHEDPIVALLRTPESSSLYV